MSGQMNLLDLIEPPAAPAPPDPLDLLLATPADRTVFDSLPDDISEEFVMGHVAAVDGSGPVPSLQGTTLACWHELRRVLSLAWSGRPRRDLPRVCTMSLPSINRERRRRVEALAQQWTWETRP
jgi:hypothetical protein